jgi:hypothetical protein
VEDAPFFGEKKGEEEAPLLSNCTALKKLI